MVITLWVLSMYVCCSMTLPLLLVTECVTMLQPVTDGIWSAGTISSCLVYWSIWSNSSELPHAALCICMYYILCLGRLRLGWQYVLICISGMLWEQALHIHDQDLWLAETHTLGAHTHVLAQYTEEQSATHLIREVIALIALAMPVTPISTASGMCYNSIHVSVSHTM